MTGPIRQFIFQGEEVEKAVDRALAALPEGTHGAVIAHYDTALGPRLSVVGKVGDQWSVVVEAWKPAHGPIEGLAEVRFTW